MNSPSEKLICGGEKEIETFWSVDFCVRVSFCVCCECDLAVSDAF
jgi:hypothetical protein